MSQSPDIIVGRIPVLECLRARRRRPQSLYIQQRAQSMDEIRAAAGSLRIQEVPRERLDSLSGGVMHQGVVLMANELPVQALDQWLARGTAEDAFVAVLDSVEDPQNFGGIVRSAAACGAKAVIFGKDRAAPLSTAATKAAAGAMEYVDLIRVTNVSRALELLKQSGFWTAGFDAAAEKDLWDADLRGRMALVVGSEGKGIRRLVLEKCDLHLRIPLTGPITSLNASVSAAIAFAECVRQRRSAQ